jgi:hypothetical protein
MTRATKFADFIKNATTLDRTRLADAIEAAAEIMTPNERKALLESLSEVVKSRCRRTARKLSASPK